MSNRTINLEDYPPSHPPALAWIKANGLIPGHMPHAQVMEVEDGLLRVCEFVLNAEGHKQIKGGVPVTTTFWTPLISAPETHGL